jgi:deoxyribodipyrimidine photo-lyase
VPELASVPVEYLAQPHTMPAALRQRTGVRIGHTYPAPIVDHGTAYRAARERIVAIRRTAATRAEADRLQAKDGSRRSGLPQTSKDNSRRVNSRRNVAQTPLRLQE